MHQVGSFWLMAIQMCDRIRRQNCSSPTSHQITSHLRRSQSMSNPHPLRAMAIAVTGLSLSFGAALEAQTIYIDFGANNRQTNDPGWNNMVMTANYTHEPAVGVPLSLADSNGNPTGISVTVTDGFAFENTAGVTAGSVAGVVAGYPETAYSDSWY